MQDSIRVPAYHLTSAAGKKLLRTEALTLPTNSIIAVTGPSGAGKSLFIKSLFGWTTEAIQPVLTAAQGAFLMIQDPSQGLTPGLSLAGHFKEVSSGGDWRAWALKMLAELGLEGTDLLRRHPESFSGGERQRIMVALILIQQLRVLVCDEPAASLDPENEARLWQLLRQIRRDRTLIFITHQLDLIEEFADLVLLINEGKLVFQGGVADFFQRPVNSFHRRLINAYHQRNVLGESEMKEESTPLVQVDHLHLAFGTKVVLRNVTWHIQKGDWWWLTGPSGAGKTTLARIVAGLAAPASGWLYIEGDSQPWLLAERTPETRRKIQYIFQHGSRALNPGLTLQSQLARAYNNDLQRLQRYLAEAHLDHLNLDRTPNVFSLGEIQRLNLVRALGPNPLLIICDELFVSLDLTLKNEMMSFLEARRAQDGLTVVVITHNQDLRNQQQGRVLDLSLMAGPDPAP